MEEFQTLLILMVIVWVMGKVFRSLSLPVIFGELVGGIIVGPLFLNLIDPNSVTIEVLAELGIFFLMLHAGLEADPKELFKSSKKSILIAIGGLVVPFFGGYFTAILFGQSFTTSLYIGLCLSITAIAISVRLFKDYKITKTRLANITIGAAIIDDILALILFSVVFNLIEVGEVKLIPLLFMLAKIILFFGIVVIGGLKSAKYVGKALAKRGFTFTLIAALSLGLIAEWIGLHMIIGAFLAGLFISEEVLDKKVFAKIEDRIYGISYGFLGPIFFVSLAFHLDFSAVITAPLFLIAILVVATLGKVIGSGGMAWAQKIKAKHALMIGLAMNSRGAVELILASIGIQKGIIDSDVFSILVIMAFVTTMFSIIAMKPLAKHAK